MNEAPHGCTFIFEHSEQHARLVTDKLREFNRPLKSPLWLHLLQLAAPLQVYAFQADSSLVGGLIGSTNEIPEWLQVSILRVDEGVRGQGIGTHLMHLAEEEAQRRGCRYARLGTSQFQAPGFYVKLGYRLYGRLENCPRGETVNSFCKDLI